MAPRIRSLAFRVALLSLGLLLVVPAAARAQEPPPAAEPAAPAPAPAPTPFPIPEVAVRAEELGGELRQITGSLAPGPETAAASAAIEELHGRMAPRLADAQVRLEGGLALYELDEMEAEWVAEAASLNAQRAVLTQVAQRLEAHLTRLDALHERWQLTLASARGSDVPAAVVERIGSSIASIRQTRERVTERRKQVLTLLDRVSELGGQFDEILARVRQSEHTQRSQLLAPDKPALHTAFLRRVAREPMGPAIRSSFVKQWQVLGYFVRANQAQFLLQIALFLALVVAFLPLRRHARRWAQEDESFAPVARAFANPVASALLLTVLASLWIYPQRPAAVRSVLGLLGLLAVLPLLPGLLGPAIRPALFALAAFWVVDQVRDLVAMLPVVHRLLATLQGVAGALLILWLIQPARAAQIHIRERWRPWTRALLRLGVALFAVSCVANLAGYVSLAELLVEGTLTSLYGALFVFAGVRILEGALRVSLRPLSARGPWVLRRHVDRLLDWGRSGIRLAATLFWLGWTLTRFQLREPLWDVVRRAIYAELRVGEIAISLADLIAFGVTLLLAFGVSALVRTVLRDEVFPRVELRRGVPNAISTSVHYLVLLVGFAVALAAAGVELGRFTILAGAFGVGIGFGMQNIVNNFVSGLILLFERPIQMGDTIEVGSLVGEVKRIGVRSSTVRAWEGAEVIVPNANLISEQVVNWTLSDRQRRIDIEVGVAYGTDPERVLALLLEVAREHAQVLVEPEPTALFLGFGDSSLNFRLRAWTDLFHRYFLIRSDLAVGINRKLAEAGITIPFPQRDLHLKSVEAEVARQLRASEAPDD